MPFVTDTFNRVWAFVDQFTTAAAINRSDLDIACDDLAEGINDTSTYLQTLITAVAAQNLYLGVKATPPTLNNDGDALVAGNFYVDSAQDYSMYVWDADEEEWTSTSDLPAASDYFKTLPTATSAAALRGLLELGSASEYAASAFATAAQGALADTAFQSSLVKAVGATFLLQTTKALQRAHLGLGEAALRAIIEEDDFASDDASALVPQANIKAYVDATALAKAPLWLVINGSTGNKIQGSGGVTAARTGTGAYTVSFGTDRDSATYSIGLTPQQPGGGIGSRIFCTIDSASVSAFSFTVVDINGNAVDIARIHVTVAGSDPV